MEKITLTGNMVEVNQNAITQEMQKQIALAYQSDLQKGLLTVATTARKDFLQHIRDIHHNYLTTFGYLPNIRQTTIPNTYYSVENMVASVETTKEIHIFKGCLSHPILSDSENLDFRYVHDLVHILCQHKTGECGFGLEEFNVWKHHCKIIDDSSEILRPALLKYYLFSEIMGQACYFLEFGQFPEQTINIGGELFALYLGEFASIK